MVDWEYWRVCIVVLAVQLVAICVSSMVIGLVVYVGVVVGSDVLAVVTVVVLASSKMAKIYKMSVLVLVLVTVYAVLVNLRWNVVTLSTFIAILASIVVLLEVLVDEIIAYKHSFKVPEAIEPASGCWEIVAAIRLGNNGYGSNQFRDVIVCDKIESNDDPFGPEHTSFVHFVEIRRHNCMWKEIIVWRVSMLSGAQTSMARKQFVAFDSPFNRRFVADRLECFESRGVVFAFVVIPFFRQHLKKLLFVFDTNANGKNGQFTLPDNIIGNDFASISCLQRNIRPNGEVNGWRIRMLTVRYRLDDQGTIEFCLAKYEMELHEGYSGPTIFKESVMAIGNFAGFGYNVVRTSDGMFGVQVSDIFNHETRVLLYDPACNVYVFCADLEELGKLDEPFAAYIKDVPFSVSRYYCPTILTDRECILSSTDDGGTFARMEIKPASLLYTTGKQIFRADPSLKSRMNAAEFRNRTGMDRMSAHFEP